jgi:RNA polymerase sigma-70 factor, ECF subfamily
METTTASGRALHREGAGMPTSDEFVSLTAPFHNELLAHCYRMLGSVHDAEDMVQETLLRAWRSFGEFDDSRASMRTWLYRISTNACLTALGRRTRRPLPSALGPPHGDLDVPFDRRTEIPWLEPVPDASIAATSGDPATIVASRASVRLAFVAALQHLPARQRAVLILHDVLEWRAAEVADLLVTTPAAVNSALQRARAQLARAALDEDELIEPTDPVRRALVDRYLAAFDAADATALAQIMRDDVVLEMPPVLAWLSGRETVVEFFQSRIYALGETWRMLPTAANGQAAFALYRRSGAGVHRAHTIQVLTVTGLGIARIVGFQDPRLFATFGLPMSPAPVR